MAQSYSRTHTLDLLARGYALQGGVDNAVANPGAGGLTFATDDITGVHYPIEKLAFGALDTATLVTASVGLPVGDAGGSLTVDVGTALPAGGNNIGDVDVLSVIPGTGLSNLGKAEDTAAATTDVGVAMLAVRRDAAAVGVDADGDYANISVDATGLLRVNASGVAVPVTDNAGSLTVDNPTLSVVGGGTEATALRVTVANDSTGLLSVDDNGASLTIDNATLAVVGGGVEATALRVTIASDSTGLVSVDDNGGSLTVDGTVAVTGVSTLAEQQTQTTALQLIDDIVHASDAALNKVAAIGAQFDDVTPGTTTENNIRPVRMSIRRELYAQIRDAAGNERGANVDATNRVLASATIDAALPTGGNNIGDVDVLTVPAPLSTTGGGTEAAALRVTIANDSTGLVSVDDNGGALTVDQATAANLNAQVVGSIAHDTADAGNPVKIGARAVSVLETATLVAAADRSDLVSDLDGALISGRFVPYGDLLNERISDTAGTSAAFTTFGAPGVGIRNYVTCIVVHNAHATTNGFVDIRDGTAGAVLMTIPLPATGGAVIPLNPPLRQPTTNTALAYDVSAAITTVYISLVGFQSKT